MRKFASSILSILFCVAILAACSRNATPVSSAPPIGFSTALQQAKAENKLVLLDFTGSDWCPPCIQTHNNVFSKPAFADYARSNLIFVEVDFPRQKAQSEDVKKANQELSTKFNIEAFPTFILLQPDGKEIWREMGAFADSPAEFITALEAAKKKVTAK